MIHYYIFMILCVFLAGCDKRDTGDLVEKRGYPRNYPELSSKSTPPPLEKPDIEGEFFEAEKLL